MNTGILVLRLAVAVILIAHSTQKTFGWFQGRGIESMGLWFSDLGLRPGRTLVAVASIVEALAAISVGTGLLTPLGAAAASGAMLVAGLTMHIDAGRFWNAGGGGEYPYVLAVVAAVLGFTGPGRFSLDHLIVSAVPGFARFDSGILVGIAVAVVAALSAIPFVIAIRRSRRLANQAAAGQAAGGQ